MGPGLSPHSVLQDLLTAHPLLRVSQASDDGYRTERGLWVLVVAPESKEFAVDPEVSGHQAPSPVRHFLEYSLSPRVKGQFGELCLPLGRHQAWGEAERYVPCSPSVCLAPSDTRCRVAERGAF